jgi:putative glycosyltransferase (TIGR04372 family)
VSKMPILRSAMRLRFHIAAFHIRRIRAYPIHLICYKLIVRLSRAILGIVFLPVSVILHIAGCRVLTINTSRIGHLAIEPDLIIKAQRLGLINKKKWIIKINNNAVANAHLLDYWRKHFVVVDRKIVCFVLDCLIFFGFNNYSTQFLINRPNKSQFAYQIYARWGRNPPVISINEVDREWFDACKKRIGLQDNQWYVCVHSREGGYSPVDEDIHRHRNGDIEKLIPAINEIVERGGVVVRMGDSSMKRLPKMYNVIDYAHSDYKCERMDVLLLANAKFIFGNTSGLALVGAIFGVPCALANLVPMSTLGIGPDDISIPKLHLRGKTGEVIPFPEVMSSEVSNYRHSMMYDLAGIVLKENSEDELVGLSREMLDKLDSRYRVIPNHGEMGEKFLCLFRDGHYSHGSVSGVCEAFFRKYENLL